MDQGPIAARRPKTRLGRPHGYQAELRNQQEGRPAPRRRDGRARGHAPSGGQRAHPVRQHATRARPRVGPCGPGRRAEPERTLGAQGLRRLSWAVTRGPAEPPVIFPRPRGRAAFWLGAILVLLSFAIYPAYPLVPFLPISLWQKGGVGIALAALSWAMFLAGSALVGKKGLAYLKGCLPWHREGRSRPDVGRSVPRGQP